MRNPDIAGHRMAGFDGSGVMRFISAVATALFTLTAAGPSSAADWPAYMRDNRRSGVTEEQLRLPLRETMGVPFALRSPACLARDRGGGGLAAQQPHQGARYL